MHDVRLGRFFAVDPAYKKYPFFTPYQFGANEVIHAKELEGLENCLDPNPVQATDKHTIDHTTGIAFLNGAWSWIEGKVNYLHLNAQVGGMLWNVDSKNTTYNVGATIDRVMYLEEDGTVRNFDKTAAARLETIGQMGKHILEAEKESLQQAIAQEGGNVNNGVAFYLGEQAIPIVIDAAITKGFNKFVYLDKVGDFSAHLKRLDDAAPSVSKINITYAGAYEGIGGKTWAYVDGNAIGFYEMKGGAMTLELNIPNKMKGQGLGTQVFKDAVDELDKFKGKWVRSDIYEKGISDNLLEYNQNISAGMSKSNAAWNTWTGRQAKSNGFNNVTITPTENGVDVLFTK
jgi:hypothetical protein